MYFELYEILRNAIYGADAVLTGDMELTLTMMSTIGALFVVCVPFLVVWRVIKLFV